MTINTKTVARRQLRFNSVADILADLNTLESAHNRGTLTKLGNWPPGTLFEHLAHAVVCSFDGFNGFTFPLWLRIFAPLVKTRMLTTSFPAGYRLNKSSETNAWKSGISFEEGIELYRDQLGRLMVGSGAAATANPALTPPHPSFGRLTPNEWILYHLRHGELHLSFLKP